MYAVSSFHTFYESMLTAQGLESPAIDADISTIKAMYDVNVFGPMEMVRQFQPLLLQAKGTIVNIGSTSQL